MENTSSVVTIFWLGSDWNIFDSACLGCFGLVKKISSWTHFWKQKIYLFIKIFNKDFVFIKPVNDTNCLLVLIFLIITFLSKKLHIGISPWGKSFLSDFLLIFYDLNKYCQKHTSGSFTCDCSLWRLKTALDW